MTLETILSIFLGIGLAASVGFRVFVPLFALSIAAYFNVLELNNSWLWLDSLTTVITFGVATLFEVFAYYIPFLDNILDTMAVPLAAVAGTAIMVSTTMDLSPVFTWSLAIIAGGGSATAIASSSSAARLVSTTSTAGFANPVVSTIETLMAVFMTVISLIVPVLALILVLIILAITFKLYKKFKVSKG